MFYDSTPLNFKQTGRSASHHDPPQSPVFCSPHKVTPNAAPHPQHREPIPQMLPATSNDNDIPLLSVVTGGTTIVGGGGGTGSRARGVSNVSGVSVSHVVAASSSTTTNSNFDASNRYDVATVGDFNAANAGNGSGNGSCRKADSFEPANFTKMVSDASDNFDTSANNNNKTTIPVEEHSSTSDDDDDGDDSHFSNVASFAAAAMESIDFQTLLADDLFTREMEGIVSDSPELSHGESGGVNNSVNELMSATTGTTSSLEATDFSAVANNKGRSDGFGVVGGGHKLIVPSTIAVPQKKASVVHKSSYGMKVGGGGGGTISQSFNGVKPTTVKNLSKEPTVTCSRCSFPGADIRISCPNGCAYHARCMNLNKLVCTPAVSNSGNPAQHGGTVASGGGKKGTQRTSRTTSTPVQITKCPHCNCAASSLEMLPLLFGEMDRARSLSNTAAASGESGVGSKRTHDEMNNASTPTYASSTTTTTVTQGVTASPSELQCYEPSIPRTGRWSDEEITFRDTLIVHFLSGSLPLSNGLKLNDFLPNMLKSKQSRLAKKMKHAKLSTKYFYPKSGVVQLDSQARELSQLEASFLNSIPDVVERSEVQFHMAREWREHLAERLSALQIPFNATAWLKSVDVVERRISSEKYRNRMAKRKTMMGKAMEKDVMEMGDGIFIEGGGVWGGEQEDLDGLLEAAVLNSSQKIGGAHHHHLHSHHGKKEADSSGYVGEPNFKNAAPFLAGIASYVERNSVPFEHCDIWVPSYVDSSSEASSSDADTAPNQGNFRLSFGGSATVNVQIVKDAVNNTSATRSPLSSDEKVNFSLFGDYSEKFSFNSGSGLPGRVFESGIPAWEQFVSDAHPSMFERRGGAVQFGIKTALGLPVESPSVGRVVLVFYSKHDRSKDEGLVMRMMDDLKLLSPCPRWKLVVDIGGTGASSLHAPPVANANRAPMHNTTVVAAAKSANVAETSNKDKQIRDLILLLGASIPSDLSSPLGQQIEGLMTLRLILLRSNRTSEEEHLVDTTLLLFESYLTAGRSNQDIAIMVARDFFFHLQHQQQVAMMQQQQHPIYQQQQSFGTIVSASSPLVAPMVSPNMSLHHQYQHPQPASFLSTKDSIANFSPRSSVSY